MTSPSHPIMAILILCGVILLASPKAVAQTGGTPLDPYNIGKGPFLEQSTKSYFELRAFPPDCQGACMKWQAAKRYASSSVYKGRKGRLAIVSDRKILAFIREKFTLKVPAWIGLRFFCNFRKLVWVNGQIQPLKSPGMWYSQWFRNESTRCKHHGRNAGYMPVYLTVAKKGPASWQASGINKGMDSFLIEYPGPSNAKEKEGSEKRVESKIE